ncbi:MAG TPA: glycosyl hydrolase-related protein [Vicinamibacterales bacterium]|nr:glycosyl hydrolase-related protein [Vicinamibacterales bacterium]
MQTHIVSHTHWDREWYLTYEQFRLRLVSLIDRLLDLMETQSDYEYFHLDGQTIVLEDYLELRPHQEPRLRKLIEAGRILIGPWYDMPDEFLVSGESLVRNLAMGHRIARSFGTPMPVGYLPDLFGHVAQMPQILRNFGLDNAILWRGFGGPKAEYWWQSPDGSRVLMMHLPPEGYCNATRVHLDPEAMLHRATRAIKFEEGRTAVGQMLLMNGVDHVEPHPVIPSLARQLSTALGASVKHSTLPAYVDAVREGVVSTGVGKTLEVINGELRSGEDYANLLPGVFSARVYIKQANTRVQTLLEKRAEPLATFAAMLGARYPGEELRYAWKTLLQNHPHDSICGCSIDPVHEENMTRFARAEQVARALVHDAAAVIARAVPEAPAGSLRLVAINTTGHPFNGPIEATIDLPYESDEPRRLVDAQALDAPVVFWPKDAHISQLSTGDGRKVVFQILSEEQVTPLVMSRYETPWVLRARRLRLAWIGEIPACGYAVFDVAVGDPPSPGAAADVAKSTTPGSGVRAPGIKVSERSAENAYIRLSINDDGTVDVVDRKTGTRYARCGELEDVGDVGDEYNYSPPRTDRRITSADASNVRVRRSQTGPVRGEFRIDLTLLLPVAISADRSTRDNRTVATPVSMIVSLDADSPRVTWRVGIENLSKDHRLRLLFPVGADKITDVRAETAFGVARRAATRAVPAQVKIEVPVSYGPTATFTETGSDQCGAVLFGDGLMEYEASPPRDGAGPRLGLTLLRCVGYLSREDLVMRPSGHAGPGLATPGAQCLGSHEFRVAFEPRREPPPGAALFARASTFSAPPHVVQAIGAGGEAPLNDVFLKLDPGRGATVLSACQQAADRDSIIVRLFNPDETPAGLRISAKRKITHAYRVDFLEARHDELQPRDGVVDVLVGPHQICTFELVTT